MIVFSFFSCHPAHRALHSFPTRRSSDLGCSPIGRTFCGIRGEPGSLAEKGSREPCYPHRNTWLFPQDFQARLGSQDRKSTRLNSSHVKISYAVFCLKKKKKR